MTDKQRQAMQQALEWFEWFHKGNSMESPASSTQCAKALRAALAEEANAEQEREAFEAWVAKVQPTYWRAEAWQTEAWAMWQSISAAHDLPEPAQSEPAGEPVYQYQKGDGSWIDQTESSYQYNAINGAANLRILYTAPPAPKWLTDEDIHNADPYPHVMSDAHRVQFARALEAKIFSNFQQPTERNEDDRSTKN